MSHDEEHVHSDPNYDPASMIGQAGYFHATDYSIPYMSRWSRIHDSPVLKKALQHMGCSYMGTAGTPPTLLALKQHAQSLAVLITLLDPSVGSGRVDGRHVDHSDNGVTRTRDGKQYKEFIDDPKRRLERNDAFDWLQDLSEPYWNDDLNHHKPLNALVNEVKDRRDVMGTTYHCPLEDIVPRDRAEQKHNAYYKQNVAGRPYASHHGLVMHANACLERLDHEFSATGGLLSLIPEDGEGANTRELEAAQNSLLGEWLLYTQSLVVRMHELEMSYGNAVTALAGEAVVPHQHLSVAGPDGRSGREIAYPQDRWILANAGDDVWDYLHDRFDREEARVEEGEKVYRDGGVSGDRMWTHECGGYTRGIVPVTVNTRYYRLQGKGRSTIFVLPAWERHPGTKGLREMETKPGVVSVVTPKYPERTTALEQRYNDRVAAVNRKETDNSRLSQENRDLKMRIGALRHEMQRNQTVADYLQHKIAEAGGDAAKVDMEQLFDEYAELKRKEDTEARAQKNLQKVRDKLRQAINELTIQRANDNPGLAGLRNLEHIVMEAGILSGVGPDNAAGDWHDGAGFDG